jgi:hypothetical protein
LNTSDDHDPLIASSAAGLHFRRILMGRKDIGRMKKDLAAASNSSTKIGNRTCKAKICIRRRFFKKLLDRDPSVR